jgi:hypothetical protein
MSGSFSSALSQMIIVVEKSYIKNFTQSYSTASVQEFKEILFTKWNDINWEINIKHENNNPPIITKSNFRVDNSMVFGMVVGSFNEELNGIVIYLLLTGTL